MLPPFAEGLSADLPAPCTFDFNVASTKYFHALEDGFAPLNLLFSGTVFYEGAEGRCRSLRFRGTGKRLFGCRCKPGKI